MINNTVVAVARDAVATGVTATIGASLYSGQMLAMANCYETCMFLKLAPTAAACETFCTEEVIKGTTAVVARRLFEEIMPS